MIAVEPTAEQRLRKANKRCLACGATLNIGVNYPVGPPIPRTLELWCPACKVVSVYTMANPVAGVMVEEV